MDPLANPGVPQHWSAAALRPGARLGRYELLVPIGYGGMACVWAARFEAHRGFRKLVAVKTILPHLASDPEFQNMLLDEARIAASVRHPNVCDLYELGEDSGVLYLSMEWVDGGSLLHVLRDEASGKPRALEPRIAARSVAYACAGLHAVHELTDERGRPLGVVHRDVNPHNILASRSGLIKIADFGVVKARGQVHQTTKTGEMKGKIAYMAPEQIRGARIDRRADVFALGCVLYQVTTGQQPFRGDNDAIVLQAILNGTYEPPDRLVANYPRALSGIIRRALALEPERRFETADEMRVALEDWLAWTGAPLWETHLGNAVRGRIGPQLDKRLNLVKTAMGADRDLLTTRPVGQERFGVPLNDEQTSIGPSDDALTTPYRTTETPHRGREPSGAGILAGPDTRPELRSDREAWITGSSVSGVAKRPGDAPPRHWPRAAAALLLLLAAAGAGALWIRNPADHVEVTLLPSTTPAASAPHEVPNVGSDPVPPPSSHVEITPGSVSGGSAAFGTPPLTDSSPPAGSSLPGLMPQLSAAPLPTIASHRGDETTYGGRLQPPSGQGPGVPSPELPQNPY